MNIVFAFTEIIKDTLEEGMLDVYGSRSCNDLHPCIFNIISSRWIESFFGDKNSYHVEKPLAILVFFIFDA